MRTAGPRRTPWFLRRRFRYLAAAALVVDLGLGVLFTGMAVAASAASTVTPTVSTSSAVTVAWTDNRSTFDSDYTSPSQLDPNDSNQQLFSNLQVTVSQTQDLTDQGLQVSWTGGLPTSPAGAASNFLQIMQCWAGKGQSGPTPQQCQWGTPNSALGSQTGTAAATRDLLTGSEADPKQDLGAGFTHTVFGQGAVHGVPFAPATSPKSLTWTQDPSDFPPFSATLSNEVTMARTGANGTGQYIVNLQSALSAPYLGCGNTALTAAGDTCWLVIVPRGEYNPNGELASDQQFNPDLGQNPSYVAGSPLSASVWQDRMQVQLHFTPIGANCQLGEQEVDTAGSELVSQAFSSWQAPLCKQGTNFAYSNIGDDEAKTDILSAAGGLPSLGFMSSPIDPTTLGSATVDYAPVTTSAIVVSYLIDKSYTSDSSNPDAASNGTLVTDLKLDPRLIAKLLTQSYKADTPGDGIGQGHTVPTANPESLRHDPEFLALNPNFTYFHNASAPDGLIVPFGNSDAAHLVWNWVCSDSEARQFLQGKADPWGATVNPAYKSLGICNSAGGSDLYSFPKADASTAQAPTNGSNAPSYGTLDMRPYAASFTDGAVRTVNAKSGSKIFWDETVNPPQFSGGQAQAPGSRFEMAITTSQAAALYGLPTAALVPDGSTSSDTGVLPTAAAMTKQLSANTATTVAGVTAPNPGTWVDGGYPLTMQTYAAVNVCAASTSDLTAYSNLLSYAASSAGQTLGTKLGQLPLGYAPLAKADKQTTTDVASDLRSEVSDPKCASHKTSSSPSSSPTSSPTSSSSSSSGDGTTTGGGDTTGGAVGGNTTTDPTGTSTDSSSLPSSGASASTPADATDAAPGGVTPAAYVTPAARYALLAALCFALPCAVLGPRLLFVARRRAGDA